MSNNLRNWVICGRLIGKASGWDHVDTWVMQLYDFKPHKDCIGPVPSGDISLNFKTGTIENYNEDGTVYISCDLIEMIKDLPRKKI